jgi:ABC-type antimicrobial peptide transport system permease subunit
VDSGKKQTAGGDYATGDSGQRTAHFGLWLSWQELKGRKVILAINVILIALLISLPVSLDLIGKAKKSSIEKRVDYIGPSLILVPRGILSSDLVTAQMKGKTYPASAFSTIKRDLSSHLRNAEARLTARVLIDGKDMPAAGIDFQHVYSYPFTKYSISGNEVLLGEIASKKLKKGRDDTLRIKSQTFTVAGIIPTTGGIEDVSVFLSLSVLQKLTSLEDRINEIRLFPFSASSYEQLKLYLKKYAGQLNLIDAYRGDTAELDIDRTLLGYQKALYTVAFVLIALCIMISTYINLDGRKEEISTVYTLGAKQGGIFQILTYRTIWITLLGSVTGQFIALLVTAIQDYQVPLRFIWSTASFIKISFGTVCFGVVVTIPFALYSVYKRDLIAHL